LQSGFFHHEENENFCDKNDEKQTTTTTTAMVVVPLADNHSETETTIETEEEEEANAVPLLPFSVPAIVSSPSSSSPLLFSEAEKILKIQENVIAELNLEQIHEDDDDDQSDVSNDNDSDSDETSTSSHSDANNTTVIERTSHGNQSLNNNGEESNNNDDDASTVSSLFDSDSDSDTDFGENIGEKKPNAATNQNRNENKDNKTTTSLDEEQFVQVVNHKNPLISSVIKIPKLHLGDIIEETIQILNSKDTIETTVYTDGSSSNLSNLSNRSNRSNGSRRSSIVLQNSSTREMASPSPFSLPSLERMYNKEISASSTSYPHYYHSSTGTTTTTATGALNSFRSDRPSLTRKIFTIPASVIEPSSSSSSLSLSSSSLLSHAVRHDHAAVTHDDDREAEEAAEEGSLTPRPLSSSFSSQFNKGSFSMSSSSSSMSRHSSSSSISSLSSSMFLLHDDLNSFDFSLSDKTPMNSARTDTSRCNSARNSESFVHPTNLLSTSGGATSSFLTSGSYQTPSLLSKKRSHERIQSFQAHHQSKSLPSSNNTLATVGSAIIQEKTPAATSKGKDLRNATYQGNHDSFTVSDLRIRPKTVSYMNNDPSLPSIDSHSARKSLYSSYKMSTNHNKQMSGNVAVNGDHQPSPSMFSMNPPQLSLSNNSRFMKAHSMPEQMIHRFNHGQKKDDSPLKDHIEDIYLKSYSSPDMISHLYKGMDHDTANDAETLLALSQSLTNMIRNDSNRLLLASDLHGTSPLRDSPLPDSYEDTDYSVTSTSSTSSTISISKNVLDNVELAAHYLGLASDQITQQKKKNSDLVNTLAQYKQENQQFQRLKELYARSCAEKQESEARLTQLQTQLTTAMEEQQKIEKSNRELANEVSKLRSDMLECQNQMQSQKKCCIIM